MEFSLAKRNKIIAFFACILISFLIGYVHHAYFFPLLFHGDAAAHHVLAKAMIEEGCFLPKDFAYGNQLIFWRSSPFIALAILFGFKGYVAFAVGSALSVSFWGGCLYIILTQIAASEFKAIALTTCCLIPLGYWGSDFVLGQQSHLANAIFSLGCFVFLWKFIKGEQGKYLALSNLCLFFMTIEAPMRGMLVVVPLFMTAALFAKKNLVKSVLSLTGITIIASILNRILLQAYPLRVDYFKVLTFKSFGEVLGNLERIIVETFSMISSLNIFAGSKLSVFSVVLYIAGLLIIILYFINVVCGANRAIQLLYTKLHMTEGKSKILSSLDGADFLHLGGVFGFFVGCLAVAALNPDTARHYIWAFFLLKVVMAIKGSAALEKHFSTTVSAVILIMLSLFASHWQAIFAINNFTVKGFHNVRSVDSRTRNVINSSIPRKIKVVNTTATNRKMIMEIKKASEKTGIKNIYGGDFWRMMPINTFIDGINAQTIIKLGKSHIEPYVWLSRPSWAITNKPEVLYLLKHDQIDKVVENHLRKKHGKQIFANKEFSIWKGPVIWANR